MSVSCRHRTGYQVIQSEAKFSHSAGGVSLRDAVDEYLIYLKAVGRSSATTASYSASLAVLTASVPEAFPLSALSADFPVNWMAVLSAPNAGGQRRRSETTLKPLPHYLPRLRALGVRIGPHCFQPRPPAAFGPCRFAAYPGHYPGRNPETATHNPAFRRPGAMAR